MLKIAVTQDHIDKGHRANPRGCALSLALTDALGASWKVSVGDVYFRWPDYGDELPLPKRAIAFRRAYDRKEPVAPFTFSIPDPRE